MDSVKQLNVGDWQEMRRRVVLVTRAPPEAADPSGRHDRVRDPRKTENEKLPLIVAFKLLRGCRCAHFRRTMQRVCVHERGSVCFYDVGDPCPLHPEHIKVLLVADHAELPPWMHRLRNLRMLKVGPAKGLVDLDFLENMPDIMTIDLAYTPRLRKLPACIVNCRSLKRLILRHSCRLERLPAGLAQMPSLSEIHVSTKNLFSEPSIVFPPQDVCDRGTRAIKEYLLTHMDQD